MFDCDFFEVVLPILVEPDFLQSVTIIQLHDPLHTHCESALKQLVSLIPRFDHHLVVRSVFDRDVRVYLILNHLLFLTAACLTVLWT